MHKKGIIMQNNNIVRSYLPRTDIATECVELHFKSHPFDKDGLLTYSENIRGINCDTLEIFTDQGAEKLGKPKGKYMTFDVGQITLFARSDFERTVEVCAEKLRSLLPIGGSCLLACLGNRQISADAQGPLCAEHFIVSRHIKNLNPELFGEMDIADTMCIVPDVLGNTGVEAASVVKGIVDRMTPDYVIAVDSLAARKTARIGCTLQMSDAGIAPGSGVGNHRTALSTETLGIPVISVGIPTVVDAVTVGADVLEEVFAKTESKDIPEDIRRNVLRSVLEGGSYGYFVSPKNSDEISECAAKLIGMTINKALNPHLDIAEMEELV